MKAVCLGAFLTVLMGSGACNTLRNDADKKTEENSIKGAELSIRCAGSVKETLYVDVISGQHKEGFGVISAGPQGRDGGATVGFGPMEISSGLTIQWGIEGVDDFKKEHRAHFDLSRNWEQMKEVKAVVLYYSGDGKWEFRAYDKCVSQEDKKLLFTIQPSP